MVLAANGDRPGGEIQPGRPVEVRSWLATHERAVTQREIPARRELSMNNSNSRERQVPGQPE